MNNFEVDICIRGFHIYKETSTPSIYVYDSVYSSIDQHTKKLIMQLLGDVDVELQNCPKQRGSDDCGLYAIAICTSLAHGHQPTTYIQETTRNHLVKCFEENFLTVFP